MVLVPRGLVAVSLEEADAGATDDAIARALGVSAGDVPGLRLIRIRDELSWVGGGPSGGHTDRDRDRRERAHGGAAMSEHVARAVVNAVGGYYARAVCEPAVRGFLSILEKQFPRSDLYIFELLQNAVDDGARHVVVEADRRDRGLSVRHDGRRFTALDVVGLASVGLSTKGGAAAGERRTIGFMGVGFKAVYKRFARVVVHDDTWAFLFEEPTGPRPRVAAGIEPSHGWVMTPRWAGAAGAGAASSSSSSSSSSPPMLWDGEPSSETAGWCHFQVCARSHAHAHMRV